MGVFHIFKIVWMVPNRAKHHIFGNVIRCSALCFWVVYFIYFKFTPVFFLMDVFNGYSLIQLKKLRKEISRLLSKGMSNIYLKVTIEKKWRAQNFDFKSLNGSPPG